MPAGGTGIGILPVPGSGDRTEIYRFDTSQPGPPRYAAAGAVDGWLVNQYAMSEWEGHLRVATTSAGTPDQPSASTVYVLGERDGALVETGSVGGLGEGERIYSVRFAGPVGYVVTFRQVDPLYTLDLRDPARPKVVGELKITGYSAYLHPVDDKTLIGVGQEATEEGRRLGTQVSVFDVGDPARPRRIAQYQLPGGASEVEFDPHAFLYWPKSKLLVIPVNATNTVSIEDGPGGTVRPPELTSGALVLSLRDDRLVEQGMIRHPADVAGGGDTAVRRSLITGDTLWTVSARGLRADGVASLTQQAWLPFG
jgi:hypothetical protein